ncbi:unnamed protein product [Cladocopium goreaui]|uniref:Ammonium transporter AmtB-like domain-containing protein n=1 Tax=Cladocopium goreaui TaxID=2562237 RepID=A0A9P1GEX2_9DINO|nr:unnamed protein product [Cladocopium goreaui]
MAVSRVLFIGDSSLYCCRQKGKKRTRYIDDILNARQIAGLQVKSHRCNGGSISHFLQANLAGFDKVCISYFGNDASGRWTERTQAQKFQQWSDFFRRLQGQKVVFWVGGFSLKYGLQPHYDTQMNLVRSWIRAAGFQVVTAFDKVAAWEMGNMEHVHWDTAEELGDFWFELLSGKALPPSYFCQRLPTTALVFNKGWRSANGQASSPRDAGDVEAKKRVEHVISTSACSTAWMPGLSEGGSSIGQISDPDEEEEAPAGVPVEAPAEVPADSAPAEAPKDLERSLSERTKPRWLRPRRRWRHKLPPLEQPRRRWRAILRPHLHRPEKPEGISFQQCWHRSNDEGCMLYFRCRDTEKACVEGYLAFYGTVQQLEFFTCAPKYQWGWAKMDGPFAAAAVLHAA